MSENHPTFLFIDTYSLFFRAFYALPDMRTSRGEATSAMYGFLSLLLKLLREKKPAGIAFALDLPQETIRRQAYAPYKAQRAPVNDNLLSQLARLHELLSLLEVPVLYSPGHEADDVLATMARRFREQAKSATVVSGDRDLLQLAHGSVRVLFVGARGKPPMLYDETEVVRRFGLPPQKLPSWSALTGDPSDNLPKVPGVGPRTATRLVLEFGNMTGLAARIAEVQPEKLRAVLQQHREQTLLTERLATLVDDVPLPAEANALPIAPHAFDRLRELFVELEFRSLLPRLEALAGDQAAAT